jgi:hypothetical protein
MGLPSAALSQTQYKNSLGLILYKMKRIFKEIFLARALEKLLGTLSITEISQNDVTHSPLF